MTGAIDRVCLTHLQIPLKEPVTTAGVEATVKDAVLVTLETPEGVGMGEASPSGASHRETPVAVEACWEELCGRIAPSLLGRELAVAEEILGLSSAWTGDRSAAAGAETACWDLLGRARRATLAEMLGASPEQVARGVESGLAVGHYPTIVELLRAVETHLAEGFRRVKLRVQPGHDVEVVRAVRQHFGADLPLMVDACASYSVSDRDVFRALDELDLLMIEQPLPSDDLDGLAALQSAIETPICLDGSADTPEHTAEAIRRGAGRIVCLKIQRLGGFGPALAVHDLCLRAGVACWVGTTPELGVGQTQGIHLATLPNCKYPTDVEPGARWFVDDYIVPPIELSAPGLLSVPTRPGLGVEVDHAKVRHYQVRQRAFTARSLG